MDRGNSLPCVLEQKIYPYEMLVVTNKGRTKLPPGVDRMRLEVGKKDVGHPTGTLRPGGRPGASLNECPLGHSVQLPPHAELSHSLRSPVQRHLSAEDFSRVFAMSPEEFGKLALWKRNELKKKASLF
ncbi:hypothetical protein P7K49_027516 [Saguinus oedipus]|uniref:HP domain-containing protein n=1 Tax=Saguinus oedipus TaxID=9490 RepID=A0ABQ9U9R0_SAGOE|nr:hypothetical protein P7K49_027516 [Saguinus oedipus]